MTPSFEAWLVVGILGFYLYDSMLLLAFNEVVFVERYGRWNCSFPSFRWQVLGKSVYMPNPLRPDDCVFQLAWSTDSQDAAGHSFESTDKLIDALKGLRYCALVLLVLMMAAVPAVILLLGAGAWFFVLLIMTYAAILAMLYLVYRRRTPLGLSKRGVASIGFESLLCPPFAINMVRRISLKHVASSGVIGVAQHYLDKERFRDAVARLRARLTDELDLEGDDNARGAAIRACLARLDGLAP